MYPNRVCSKLYKKPLRSLLIIISNPQTGSFSHQILGIDIRTRLQHDHVDSVDRHEVHPVAGNIGARQNLYADLDFLLGDGVADGIPDVLHDDWDLEWLPLCREHGSDS